MKSLRNHLFIFSVMIAIVSCSNKEDTDSVQILSVQEFEEEVAQNNEAIILDVRTPEEFSEGHISGALNTDFLNENFQKEIENLDKNKTYILYCKSGIRQEKAGIKMKELGFENIYLLDGGFVAWDQQSKAIEK